MIDLKCGFCGEKLQGITEDCANCDRIYPHDDVFRAAAKDYSLRCYGSCFDGLDHEWREIEVDGQCVLSCAECGAIDF